MRGVFHHNGPQQLVKEYTDGVDLPQGPTVPSGGKKEGKFFTVRGKNNASPPYLFK